MSTEVSRYVDTYDVTLDVCLSSVDQQAYVLNQLTQLVCASSILCPSSLAFTQGPM